VAAKTGPAFAVIDVIDLSHVRGGVDSSAEIQRALAQVTGSQATGAYVDSDRIARPQGLLSGKRSRRSGSGPMSAPALPPTSTLTR
jgi:hypothetical protein